MGVCSMTKSDERRADIRQRLMRQVDVADAAMHYAAHGQVDTEDLWWLYDEAQGAWIVKVRFRLYPQVV